jgi:hypothetical protein
MVVDGFGSGFGLVSIFGSCLLVSSLVLYRATTVVLCGTTTLVLCGITTLVLCGTTTLVLCGTITLVLYGTAVVLCGAHHPLWLSFCLIGWYGLLVRFWDESLWFLVKVVRQPFGSCGLRGNPRSRPL